MKLRIVIMAGVVAIAVVWIIISHDLLPEDTLTPALVQFISQLR